VFTRTHALPAGPRVRLRLARPSDVDAVTALAGGDELRARRLVTFDPAQRTVLAAFAPVDGVDVLVGIAGIDHAPGAEMDTVITDDHDGVAEVLARRLKARAGRVA
jgi:hypothetical protein